MNNKKKLVGIGIAGLFLLTGLSGCIQQQGPGSNVIIIPAVSGSFSDNPKYAMASYYSSEEVTINAQPPQYNLPLDLTSIINYDTVDGVLILTDQQKSLLRSHGFFIRDFGAENDIIEPYEYLKTHDIPIFVTSDTLLHLYHIQFDQTLKAIEEREFFDKILDLSITLFDKSKQDYETYTNSELKEAARRNVGFFGVALSLLQTPTDGYNNSETIKTISFSIPSYVSDNVTEELSYIEAHEGFENSPIFHYKEDYSQYKPRGHYTQSEKLKRYFKTLMWYGRIAFLLRGSDIISEKDATIATIQACLISTALPTLTVSSETLQELWNRVYIVTAFFVGTADDLTPFEYLTNINAIFGSQFNATDLLNETKIFELKAALAQLRNPQIYGGTGEIALNPPFSKEQLYEALEKTKGLRLMGQRYIPDSYMFQQLVFPAVGHYTGNGQPFTMSAALRVFPRGLDVMAVLGSTRAREILEQEGDTDYVNYSEQLTMLTQNFSSLNITEWNRNLYFSWVYTLRALLHQYNESFPSFMQTTTWQDKELHTALASWTELRHDTILYAKQSNTLEATAIPPQEKPVVGYVEPVPEFYARILALTKMTRTGLTDLHVLNETETARLTSLETILSRLLNISKDELEAKELTEDDYEFIRTFGDQLDWVVTGVNNRGKETSLIADVHTDTNTGQVLEEGVGYVDLMLVAYKVPDGRIIAGAGPVFSYYEFKQPMDNRLTDEQWIQQLEQGTDPDRPAWTSSFIVD